MQKGFFVTGTDTGVGKTTVTVLFLKYLIDCGISVFPYKPIESGANPVPEDASAFHRLVKDSYTLEQICPFALKQPISPARAAKNEGVTITLDYLVAPLEDVAEMVVAEGAGGFCSPLTSDGLVCDFAKRLGLPVILVVKDSLGCISQSILNQKTIESMGLKIAFVVLNCYDPESMNENLSQLQQYMNYPVFALKKHFDQKDQNAFFAFCKENLLLI